MLTTVYRYGFSPALNLFDIEQLIVAAVSVIEDLHGEAAARLDVRHYLDETQRRCVVDADSTIGIEFNKLFAGALTREFGPDSFRVERVASRSPAEVR